MYAYIFYVAYEEISLVIISHNLYRYGAGPGK